MKIVLTSLSSLVLLGIAALAVFVFIIQNVETPKYEVVLSDGPFEIRRYPSLVVANVERTGTRNEALSDGFSPLARYIFAKDREGEQVSMTTPVIQRPSAISSETGSPARAAFGWRIGFIMPSAYALEALPAPASHEVRLEEVAPKRVATVRFNGRTTDALIADRERALRDWIHAQQLEASGSPVYAYYNDPRTPGFLRRNEIIIEIAAPQAAEAEANRPSRAARIVGYSDAG